MKVIFTDTARNDLAAVGDYIRLRNPIRAASFLAQLLDHCESLADMPLRNPVVPRYEHQGIRRSVHANYLIFYRVGTEHIEVLHVLHGAQDYEPILFPPPPM